MNRNLLIALIVIGVVALLFTLKTFTGYVSFLESDEGVIVADELHLSPNELRTCCIFEEEGEERTCQVIIPYDCSYCDAYC